LCKTFDVDAKVRKAENPSSLNNWSRFRPEEVTDFKHLIYNLLVDWHNNPEGENLVEPCTIIDKGTLRHGFKFNEKRNPDKKLVRTMTIFNPYLKNFIAGNVRQSS
jgi:hypothetical protein